MGKKQDESKNEFRCMICQDMRLRGVWVTVKKGDEKGAVVKVCKKAECFEMARNGKFYEAVERFGHKLPLKPRADWELEDYLNYYAVSREDFGLICMAACMAAAPGEKKRFTIVANKLVSRYEFTEKHFKVILEKTITLLAHETNAQ